MQIANVKQLQKKACSLTIEQLSPRKFAVSSGSGKGEYIVTLTGQNGSRHWTCTCPWAERGGVVCCHRMAVMSHLAGAKMGRRLSFWLNEADALRQHLPRVQRNGLWVTMRRMPT